MNMKRKATLTRLIRKTNTPNGNPVWVAYLEHTNGGTSSHQTRADSNPISKIDQHWEGHQVEYEVDVHGWIVDMDLVEGSNTIAPTSK